MRHVWPRDPDALRVQLQQDEGPGLFAILVDDADAHERVVLHLTAVEAVRLHEMLGAAFLRAQEHTRMRGDL